MGKKLRTFKGSRKFRKGLRWLELLAAAEIHSLSAILSIGVTEGGAGRPFEFSFNPHGWGGQQMVWCAETDIDSSDPDSKQVAGWGKTPAEALAYCIKRLGNMARKVDTPGAAI